MKIMLALLVSSSLFAVPQTDPWWHCTGHVQACTSPSFDDTYGCADASGVGPTERDARSDGAHDCQLTLRGQKGGDWTCTDASAMKCWKDTNANANAESAPVEGHLNYTCNGEITCRRKDGEAFPCSLSTYENAVTQAQAEEQARESMITTCSSRWGTEKSDCDVDALACKPTY